ncbi:MAG: hypothetical protein H7Y09_02190 [Chitinophagaceae bacterium]|nr:hypothetical protein [Anaerolineae bacterium]
MPRFPRSWHRQSRYDNAARVYQFVEAFNTAHAYLPSLREVADGCFMGRATVVRYLDILEGWGCLTREPGVARSITITGRLPTPETTDPDEDEDEV